MSAEAVENATVIAAVTFGGVVPGVIHNIREERRAREKEVHARDFFNAAVDMYGVVVEAEERDLRQNDQVLAVASPLGLLAADLATFGEKTIDRKTGEVSHHLSTSHTGTAIDFTLTNPLSSHQIVQLDFKGKRQGAGSRTRRLNYSLTFEYGAKGLEKITHEVRGKKRSQAFEFVWERGQEDSGSNFVMGGLVVSAGRRLTDAFAPDRDAVVKTYTKAQLGELVKTIEGPVDEGKNDIFVAKLEKLLRAFLGHQRIAEYRVETPGDASAGANSHRVELMAIDGILSLFHREGIGAGLPLFLEGFTIGGDGGYSVGRVDLIDGDVVVEKIPDDEVPAPTSDLLAEEARVLHSMTTALSGLL